MATDIEKLVVQLSADFKGFEKALARQQGVANKQFNAIERRARQMNKNLDGLFSRSFSGLKTGIAGVGAALGANELRKLTDTWTDMNSRVALAAGGVDQGVEVMGRLGEMARRTYSDLEQTAEGYLANATALKELGYNTDQALDYTEALNNALVVSGAKGQTAATVTDALAKAMALGKLSGQNLNTVIAQGGRVAEALAAGLNTTVGGLRKLGAQGKITGTEMVKALSSQMELLRKEAADMPATIGDGFTLLNNALLQYVGNADSATGVSAKISEALVMIADNFDTVADVGLKVAGVIAGALVGRSLLTMIRTLGLAGTALKSFISTLRAAQTMGGLAAAFSGVGAAAGPVGILIGGAVVSSILLYNSTLGRASEASDIYAAALKRVKDQAEEVPSGVDAATASISAGAMQNLKEAVALSASEIEKINQQIIDNFDHMLRSIDRSVVDPIEIEKVEKLKDEFKGGAEEATGLARSLDDVAKSNPQWINFANSVAVLAGQLRDASAAARMLNNELSGAMGPDSNKVSRATADPYIVQRQAENELARDFEKNALRRAGLKKGELDLENKITDVRKRLADQGVPNPGNGLAERIAKAELAGEAARSAEGKKPPKEKKKKQERDNEYERLTKSITERTSAMLAETEVQRQLNPLVNDYGYAIEKARAEHDLMTAAVKAGVAITPELKAEISKLAEQYALAGVEAEKLSESQDKIKRNAEEMAEFQKDLTRGIIDGFVQGKKAADVFADALSKIGNKLLDIAMNSLFSSNGGGGLGGLLGGFLGFSSGGYTGDGGVNQPAGVVHKGEVVWSQKDVARAGGVAAVEAMRRGMRGYAAGGAVAMPALKAPTMPILKAANNNGGGGVTMTFAPVIDARGADQAAVDRLEAGLMKTNREIESRVIQTIRKAQKSNVRF